jgi:uncharacterized protein YecE (DUF72 family)
MNIYTGTSGFAHKEWKGKFYPEKIAAKDLLHFYAERLNTVEINNTFYHMPNGSVLASWADQVGKDFVFALKAPQTITHIKRLQHVSSEMSYLFKALSVMEKKLGPVLFQFPESFRADRTLLEDFLGLIRSNAACAFEFRHPSWIEAGVQDLLQQKGCSLCIADTDENPANEIISTAPWGYLRLRRNDYTDADLSQWVERILAQKWNKAFVYFKHEGEAIGPELAMRFNALVDVRLNGNKVKQAGIG